LIHEHVFSALPGFEIDYRQVFEDESAVKLAVSSLRAAREFGLKTVVDASPIPWYRRPDLLKRISEESEVYIVASTGIYTERMGWPIHLKLLSVEEIAQLFIYEIEKGIQRSSVQAGVIKLATGGFEVGKYERKAIFAAVIAQKSTGVGIITHTEDPRGGIRQLDTFEEAGADLSKVMIGHMDNSQDLEYHMSVAKRGASVGFDRIGHYKMLSHESRLNVVESFIRSGYSSQMLLSHDYVAYGQGRFYETEEQAHWQEYGYTYLFRELLPQLEKRSVDKSLIHSILVDNPMRILGG
jgi:phosphotriesterase-related protein